VWAPPSRTSETRRPMRDPLPPSHPDDSTDAASTGEAFGPLSRRGLIRAALIAAPALVTLTARPAFAQTDPYASEYCDGTANVEDPGASFHRGGPTGYFCGSDQPGP